MNDFCRDKCGLWCRLRCEIHKERSLASPNDVCRWLEQKTNFCQIHEEHPIFCNVDKYYEKIVLAELYEMNQKTCQKMKEQYAI